MRLNVSPPFGILVFVKFGGEAVNSVNLLGFGRVRTFAMSLPGSDQLLLARKVSDEIGIFSPPFVPVAGSPMFHTEQLDLAPDF